MTHARFQQLDARAQVTIALMRGIYLVRRIGPTGPLALYHVPNDGRGFFVELGQDQGQGRTVVKGSFDTYQPLGMYTDFMHLGLSFLY